MRKISIKLLIFLIPIALVYFLIEWKWSKISNGYIEKRELLQKNLQNVEVLVLGPSTAEWGVNPDYFSYKGFNLSYVSQTIFYDKRLTLKYIDNMPNLKLVIISLSFTSLFSQLHNGPEEWRDYFYYRFWGITYKDLPILDMRRYSYISLYSIGRTKNAIMHGFTHDPSIISPSGFVKILCNDSMEKTNNGKEHADLHNSLFNKLLKKDPDLNEIKYIVNDLGDLVAKLQKHNIKVALLTPPVYHTYSDYCNKNIIIMNDSLIHKICEQYSCRYINYSNDARFTPSDFTDGDHLCADGATKFSQIINKEIINYTLKQYKKMR